jgi:hypothetical protein
MYNWIIEADIYRLRKAAAEATNQRDRRELEILAQHKLETLSAYRRTEAGGRPDA